MTQPDAPPGSLPGSPPVPPPGWAGPGYRPLPSEAAQAWPPSSGAAPYPSPVDRPPPTRSRVPRWIAAVLLLAALGVAVGGLWLTRAARGTGFVELRFTPGFRLDRHEILLAGEPLRTGGDGTLVRRAPAGPVAIELRERGDGARQLLCRVQVGKDRITTVQIALTAGRLACAELRV